MQPAGSAGSASGIKRCYGLMYRHGLRVSEARHTKWSDFDLTPGSGPKTFHVRRLKGSRDGVHTLDRDEISALRKLKAESTSPYVFVSEAAARSCRT